MIHIAKGGLSWIIVSFALFFVVLVLVFFILSSFLLLLCFFCFLISCLLIVFFRDPERTIGTGIVAVADGTIREVASLPDPDIGDSIKVSTFMNIHNVHVNRMPFDGTILKITHHAGGHLPAFTKESDVNERVVLLIHTSLGLMKVVQIAGTIARRIVPYVHEGDTVKKGEKLGLIRLGSRVDLFLPATRIKTVAIQVHQKIKAGEDSVAEPHG